ncbi:MAG TPA: nucleotidyltransferase domain-containing protein [Acetivibrio sp.]|jgi:predicted nucleotidyltransferase|uniref:nucleotidyltransferase domain-containing protein n=1 Tax=Acetivibrio sp. TaxID=1872092 RepID=UPI002B6472A6|nr:nucleotidyltransferase domain-containing protein [Acetivibrio sp.]HOM03592.1 nucleotidyltransferase domain-containing protein [Acetivibrio sp.]
MRILVCGNINSGKSYLIDKLKTMLPKYDIAQIDAYRNQYGDGTIEKELLARTKFVEAVTRNDNIIVELSGMGPLARQLQEAIPPKTFIILYVDTDAEICVRRLKDKDFSRIPYPVYQEEMSDTIRRIGKELINGELHQLWLSKALQIIRIISIDELTNLPFSHYEKLCDILKLLIPNTDVKEIVAFGSLGRNELSKLSDIDLSITTTMTVDEVAKLYKYVADITFIDTVENKVTIRFGDILIELVIVQNQKDNMWYYVNSMVKCSEATVIKGDADLVQALQTAIDDFSFNEEKMIEQTIKRLIFFVLSLDNIAKKGDDYKFFFHNNIIIHEIIRLQLFSKGVFQYNYLPKMALDKLEGIDIKNLLYDFNIDKQKHIKNIKAITAETLKKVGCKEKKYYDILC